MASVIAAVIQLKDQFSANLKNVNKNLSEFQRQAAYAGKNITQTGKDMQKVGGTLSKTFTVPILAVGASLIALGENFDKSYNTIRTTTGKTGQALVGLENDFRSTLSQTGASMADTSQVIADLSVRTGLAGKPLQDLSLQMLKLTKITKGDLNTLIPATTRMFQDAGIKQADYSSALDYTFKVSQQTGIGVGRLQELMTQFGGPLRQMGFDWQTSATMLGKFEKEGVNTELVVGSLRIALGKMAKQGIADPATALKEMITQIKGAGSAGKANALALSMFGAKAGPDMAAAIREGRMDLTSLLQTLKDSPETINKAAADTATFAGKMAKMKNQMAVAFEPVGMKLVDSVEKLIPYLQRAGEFVALYAKKLADMSPKQQETILKFLLMVAVVGPVISMVGKMTVKIGTTITVFSNLSKTISRAGGIMAYLSTPGGIVLVVLAALVVAAILVVTHWDKIKKAFNDFKQVLKDNETTIRNVAIVLGTIFGPALIAVGVQATIAGVKLVVGFIASLITSSATMIANAAIMTGTMIISILSFTAKCWLNVAAIAGQTLVLIAQKLGLISAAEATGIITAAQWLFNAAMDANPIVVTIALLVLLGAGIYVVVTHFKDICTWIEKAWKWLTTWNGSKAEDKSVNVNTNYTSSSTGPIKTPTGGNGLPYNSPSKTTTGKSYATGTPYATRGRHLVGEHGPEEVDFKGGETVKTAKATKGTNGAFVINMYGITIREEADIDKVATALAKKLDEAAINAT